MAMTFGILDFPHSICTNDFVHAISRVLEQELMIVNCNTDTVPDVDVLIISDYLEGLSWPVVRVMRSYIEENRKLIGIGEGVKTLLEQGLLPGWLGVNMSERILSKEVEFQVDNPSHFLTNAIDGEYRLKFSVSGTHCRWILGDDYARVKANGQVLFRYCGMAGDIVNVGKEEENVAGLANEEGSVFGLLFHPERAVDDELGNTDGRNVFMSVVAEADEINAL